MDHDVNANAETGNQMQNNRTLVSLNAAKLSNFQSQTKTPNTVPDTNQARGSNKCQCKTYIVFIEIFNKYIDLLVLTKKIIFTGGCLKVLIGF